MPVIDINFDDAVMQDEIFGPILPILEYAELTDAIIKVKQRPRPLSCYIFTNNTETKKRILNEISFGGGCINDAIMHIGNNHLPFGGVGNSGIGSYHGEAGFKAFSHYKSILEKNTYFEPNVKYSPHTPSKLKLIKILLGF
jgi:aldehyde dehydrogenase (NAD+)